MPPKTNLKKVKCIKFGEILIDENNKLILLCENCSVSFACLEKFCVHLRSCKKTKDLFKRSDTKLNFEVGTKLITTVIQKDKTLLIYDVKDTQAAQDQCDVLNIEAEILNPRWYTDEPSPSPIRKEEATKYNNLIEEVTPFVQFKENVKIHPSPQQKTKIVTSTPTIGQRNKNATIEIQAKEKPPPPHPNAIALKNPAIRQSIRQKNAQNPEAKIIEKPQKQLATMPVKSASTTNATIKRKVSSLGQPSQPSLLAKTQQVAAPPAAKRRRTETLTSTQSNASPVMVIVPKNSINNKQQNTVAQNRPPVVARRPQNVTKTVKQMPCPIKSEPLKKEPTEIVQQAVTTKPIVTTSLPNATATNDNKNTVDILNKLQNLGLKVQRTNPVRTTTDTIPNEKNNAAMEIIKKLQSKGMEVKRLTKVMTTSKPATTQSSPSLSRQMTTTTAVAAAPTAPSSKFMSPSAIKRTTAMVNSVLSTKPNFKNNVLIKKIN